MRLVSRSPRPSPSRSSTYLDNLLIERTYRAFVHACNTSIKLIYSRVKRSHTTRRPGTAPHARPAEVTNVASTVAWYYMQLYLPLRPHAGIAEASLYECPLAFLPNNASDQGLSALVQSPTRSAVVSNNLSTFAREGSFFAVTSQQDGAQ